MGRPGGRPGINQSRGFTLVEVMVALLVMSLMAVLAWRGVDALLTSRDVAQRHLDQSARLQSVLEQWELDLKALQESSGVPGLAFDGATLRITRRQPGGMQVVAWSIRDGGLYRWQGPIVRSVSALQDSFQRSGQLQTQDTGQLRALDGVAGWQMYYFRGNAWTNAQSSDGGSTTTSAQAIAAAAAAAAAAASAASGVVPAATPPPTGLPSGVRMLLQFDPSSGFAGPLTREIELGS